MSLHRYGLVFQNLLVGPLFFAVRKSSANTTLWGFKERISPVAKLHFGPVFVHVVCLSSAFVAAEKVFAAPHSLAFFLTSYEALSAGKNR